MLRVTRTKSLCKQCALNGCNKVRGLSEVDKPSLIVIGEAPGAEEDIKGKPFVGPAGGWGKYGLRESGINVNSAHFMNVINCRPPSNDIASLDALDAIEKCRPGFEQELRELHTRGVETIIAWGATAMHALGIEGPIGKNRGSVYEVKVAGKDFIVVPTFHPSYIMRGMKKEEPTWFNDMAKALDIATHGWHPPKENFQLFPSIEWLEKETKRLCSMKKKPQLAVDIETAFGQIVVVGIASSSEDAFSVPFFGKGMISYWKNGDFGRARSCLSRLLSTCPTLFQNAPFDVSWLVRAGFVTLDAIDIRDDILLAHHAIHPELPHNLGYIVSVYGATPYWKDIVVSNPKTLMAMEDADVRTYNLRDAVVLHQVKPPLLDDLHSTGTEHIYRGISMKLVKPVIEMELTGMKLDKKRHKSFAVKVKRELAKTEKKLHSVAGIPKDFSVSSPLHMARLLYGKIPDSLEQKKADIASYDDEGTRKRKDTKKYRELVDYVKTVESIEPLQPTRAAVQKNWKTGGVSTDEMARTSIYLASKTMLREVKALVRPKPFHAEKAKRLERNIRILELIDSFQELNKLSTTYTNFRLGEDGHVHPRFVITGTKTGRLSSREPNWQNLPSADDEDKLGAEVRKLFIPDPGWCFVGADYSNLELRVLSWDSDDKMLQTWFAEGVDVHTRIAMSLTGWPEDKITKTVRKGAKTYKFGRNYGGSVEGIYRRLVVRIPDFPLSLAEFREADRRHFELMPAYAKWQAKTREVTLKTRTCVTASGRKRFFLGTDEEIQREALDTRIQGPAGDVKNIALIKFYEERNRLGLKAKLVSDLHDAIYVTCPKTEKKKVARLLKECMEHEVKWWKKPVIFPVEVAVSDRSWGEMVEYEVK
ncbi:hypothetical protein KGP36_06530 [Patescibacteria group bacterium]|nr:hypothetical protein [Patescibacteria group bacterium]